MTIGGCLCSSCNRLHGDVNSGCDAYPNGLTTRMLEGYGHWKSQGDDNGIVFEHVGNIDSDMLDYLKTSYPDEDDTDL